MLLLMNKEKLIFAFIVVTSPLMLMDVFLKHTAPSFILDNFGHSMAYIWVGVLSLLHILWWLLMAFIVLMGSYLVIEQRTQKKKQQFSINSDKEIVLTEQQKQKLISREVLEVSLVFNSMHRGIEPFSDDDIYIKFAVMGSDEKALESTIEQYIHRQLGEKVLIEAGKRKQRSRWNRVVTLC